MTKAMQSTRCKCLGGKDTCKADAPDFIVTRTTPTSASEHKVEDYRALGNVLYVRKRREAGEAAYNDESTALTMCHMCKTS